jgi:hypothetical protein
LKKLVESITVSPTLADGSIPMLPVIMDASSDSMSPKMLFVTIVSNCSDRGNLRSQCSILILSQDTMHKNRRNKPA